MVAALIAGAELSLGSLIGFLALFGIATRSGMLLIRHFQRLEREEGETFGSELVRRGARERLEPIATTAAALALVALPFVVMGARPGLEVVHPMAVVILGGLVTTTFLSLFVLPSLYLRYGTPTEPGLTPEDELMHRWAGVTPETATAPAGLGAAANGDPVPTPQAQPPATDVEKETAS
jgi:Cu/Ag efflux pump CusA